MGILAGLAMHQGQNCKICPKNIKLETDLSFDFANEGISLGAKEINFMDLECKMASYLLDNIKEK